jgi:hypothetical protein
MILKHVKHKTKIAKIMSNYLQYKTCRICESSGWPRFTLPNYIHCDRQSCVISLGFYRLE